MAVAKLIRRIGCLAQCTLLAFLQASCATPDREIESDREALAKRFSIEVVSSDISSRIREVSSSFRASDPSSAALRPYLAWLLTELEPYPADAFACADIDRVILVSNLRVLGVRSRGYRSLSTGGDRRSAIPAFRDRSLILDIDYAMDPLRRKRVLHHEFFHMFDAAQMVDHRSDPEWADLNPASFEYGSGGANTSRFSDYFAPYEKTALVTGYSGTAIIEDKAEVFSLWMVMPKVIQQRIQSDASIAAKVKLLERRLNAACPGFEFPGIQSTVAPARQQPATN